MKNKKPINEEMTKAEIRELVRDTLDSELKNKVKDGKITDEEKVKNIIKDLLKKHYKTLWTKANYFIEEL
jgi:lipoate-protein ligase A